jgi:hypothetical protein
MLTEYLLGSVRNSMSLFVILRFGLGSDTYSTGRILLSGEILVSDEEACVSF